MGRGVFINARQGFGIAFRPNFRGFRRDTVVDNVEWVSGGWVHAIAREVGGPIERWRSGTCRRRPQRHRS